MKHTWKKAAAFVLATALVAGAAPANVGTGGLFGSTGIVAYAADVQFTNASVTLADDLALNFYVDGIADDTAAAEYTVNFTGACVDESSVLTYNAKEGKYYATTHVYAKDIDKDITATLCKGSDTVDTIEDYSITQYLSSPAFSGADEKTTALITATQNFGYASAEYFYDDNYGVTATFEDYNPDVSAYAPTFGSDAAKLSLVLDSKTAARLYVKGDDTGTESTISSTKADYPTYHEVTGLLPQNLADEQTITVGGTDYTFSALTWCNRVLTNGSASQKNVNMAKAIMAYYTAAKNYTEVANPAPTTASIDAYTAGTFGWSGSGSAATNLPTINTFAANDSISLLSANNANTKFTTTAGGASATFSGTAADDSKFYAVYPYTAGLTLSDDVISGVVIPTSQWNSGWNSEDDFSGWDPKAPIAYATTTGSSLTFHNACAILKVTFPKAGTYGRFTISANEPLAGTFSLDTSTGTLTPTSGSTTVTVGDPSDIYSGICTDFSGKTVYVAIAPGTYTGFNLHIYNEDDDEKSITKSTSVTFEAGKIYDLGSYNLRDL
jgi:hypothetical protein